MRILHFSTLIAVLAFASPLAAADKRPMTLEDFFAIKRIASPKISPDGKQVVYSVTTVDLKENKTHSALWIAATNGNEQPKQLTPDDMKAANPRWSPDGKQILFESAGQLFLTDADGAKPKRLTSISSGAAHGVWSPDGKQIAFVSRVYPEFSAKPFAESDKLNKEKDEEIAKSPVKARTFTKLFYRHWNEYIGDKRQHIFVIGIDGKECRDVTPGDRDAFPVSSTFSSSENFTFTPDGKHIVFTAAPAENEAWSTNYDLCRVSITNTSTKWETLTKENKAADSGPQFSPDGKKLAWRAQKKAGNEADKWDIVVSDVKEDGTLAGKPVAATANLRKVPNAGDPSIDVSVNDFVWTRDRNMWFSVDERGANYLYRLTVGSGECRPVLPPGGQIAALQCAPNGNPIVGVASTSAPEDVWYLNMTNPGETANLSRVNESLLAALELPRPQSVGVPIEDDLKMHMWVIKPPGFDEKKKWPVVYLVHGGPQSAWRDAWSYRWNPQLWAAQGYVIVMPNPRGSAGFGEKFKQEISGDWGGKCYRDLVAGLDYVEKLPYVDKDRIAAAGGSFGGYMMNWFAVNDIAPRFKCLVNHCSVWNFESMWGTTDELWFAEWENGGLPWEQPKKYAEFSPHKRAGELGKHKVPMLVIHNDLDFRCPIGQGHELFTALQRQGVPSRFVNFPDEGHHVLKPKNSEHWHKEIFAWLKKYAPPGGK